MPSDLGVYPLDWGWVGRWLAEIHWVLDRAGTRTRDRVSGIAYRPS